MDLMLDNETFDVYPTAQLASIGACLFDPNKRESIDQLLKPDRIFYASIDPSSYDLCPDFTVGLEVMEWWKNNQLKQLTL
jgi:hypothetical protein